MYSSGYNLTSEEIGAPCEEFQVALYNDLERLYTVGSINSHVEITLEETRQELARSREKATIARMQLSSYKAYVVPYCHL